MNRTVDTKINFKINTIASLWNKRYTVFFNEVRVGTLDYNNAKLGIWTTVGTHKIIVKRKDFEKELILDVQPETKVLNILIDENQFIFQSHYNVNNLKTLQTLAVGSLIGFVLVVLIFSVFGDYKVHPSFIFLLIFLIGITVPQHKVPFQLKVNPV